MHSPVFIPLMIAAAMCIGCLFAGGTSPQRYFLEWQPATLYNAVQLFFCAFLAWAIASTVKSGPAKPDLALTSTLVWSLVCAAFVYAGFDELLELHENSGPIAHWLADVLGQPGKHPVVAGMEIPSYSALIEFCYAGIAAAFVFLFHKQVFVQWTAAWMFALAAIFLGSAQCVDLILIQGMSTPTSVDVAFCQGFVKAVAYSLKLAGCASLLGALMETLLAKRRLQSVERMLSGLNKGNQSETAPHREHVSV